MSSEIKKLAAEHGNEKKADAKVASDQQFVTEVHPKELECAAQRRAEVAGRRGRKGSEEEGERIFDERSPLDPKSPKPPTVANELVGLAFSGGGIRSATINLGIAQQLHKRGVLDHVDYLSTVSGGGYTGSSISTIMRDGAEFPFEATDGPTESPYLNWIRNHSNYLATNGFIDFLRIGALLLRGIALNLLVMLPGMLAISLFLGLYYGGDPKGGLNRGILHRWQESGFGWSDSFNILPWVVAAAAVFFLAYPVVIRIFKVMTKEISEATGNESSVKQRDFYERLHAWALVAVGAMLAIETLPILLHWFHEAKEYPYRDEMAGFGAIGAALVASGATTMVKFLGGLLRKLAVTFVGLLGLLVPLLFILYVGEWLAYGDRGVNLLNNVIPSFIGSFESSVGWSLEVAKVGDTEKILVGWPGVWHVLVVLWALLTAGGLANLVARRTSNIVMVGLGGLIGAGVGIVILRFALASGLQPPVFIALLAFVTWLFCWSSLDVNLTSMQGFYRDRLASAYLVGVDTGGDVDIEQDINLPDLCQEGSIAPYQIVNVAHNLQGSKDENIRDRHSDFFIFSKNAIGGNRTGYCSSQELESIYPQIDLPTAMGISAAAASPNMGKGTGASMVAIMTLLNVRLGYWIPNPKRVAEWAADKKIDSGSLRNRWVWRVRPRALVKEFFSKLDEEWNWVNLSDGGHLENLATYELLRRRCKYIFVGDGEADPAMTFNGLADLMRFARIDMGIEIDILLEDVRLARVDTESEVGRLLDEVRVGPKNDSHQHCAFGRIHYPADHGKEKEIGYLVYLKSSVTGDEDEVINEYRANHAEFPHESTADQFFDEGQFEAYRSLGYHMAESLFDTVAPSRKTSISFQQFDDWFMELEANLAPRAAAENLFIELQSELGRIRSLLQEPEFEDYFYEIHPGTGGAGSSSAATADPAKTERRLTYLVGEQLRLMENVFVELNFERPRNWKHDGNKGWKTLFETWAAAPSFQSTFKSSIGMHSPKFLAFCSKWLDLSA